MKYFLKSLIVLCLIAILCGTTGCSKDVEKAIKQEKYSATASIITTNGAVTISGETTDKISGSDISASLYLSYTVVDILNTPDIYMELADELGEEYDYQSLQNSFVVARRSEDTLFVDITYSNSDPKKAIDIANKFAEFACDYIPEFIPSARVSIVSKATKAQKQG